MTKTAKKVVSKKSEMKSDSPVEVLLTDCITKQKIVAEYRGENKWWYGTRIYKVYHPAFEGGSRWVLKLGRILGAFDPNAVCPTPREVHAEAKTIRWLMRK
jgi:hypothetical protein